MTTFLKKLTGVCHVDEILRSPAQRHRQLAIREPVLNQQTLERAEADIVSEKIAELVAGYLGINTRREFLTQERLKSFFASAIERSQMPQEPPSPDEVLINGKRVPIYLEMGHWKYEKVWVPKARMRATT